MNPCVTCTLMQLLSRTAWFAQLCKREAQVLWGTAWWRVQSPWPWLHWAVRLSWPQWYHWSVTAATPQAFLTHQLDSHPQLISSQRVPPTHRLLILLCQCPSSTQEGKERQQEMPAHSRHVGPCHNRLCHVYCRYPRAILGCWNSSTNTSNSQSFTHLKHGPWPGVVAMSCRPTMSWPLWMSHKHPVGGPLCSWFGRVLYH